MLAPYKYIHHISYRSLSNLLCRYILITISWLFVCYVDVIVIHDGNRECEDMGGRGREIEGVRMKIEWE